MRVVLDTSAAMEIVLRTEAGEQVSRALEAAEWIEAPELFIAEAANVCWKCHRRGDLGMENCESALAQAIALPNAFVPAMELYQEAFALSIAANRAVNDMFLLALARRRGATLFSTDKGLLAFAAKHVVKTLK